MEQVVHPVSSFLVVPLFALASAGVVLNTATIDRVVTSTVVGGVALGLLVGKPLGIVGATFAALRFRRARLPTGMRVSHVAGVGLVAGIGFTVSLFIANLSFDGARLDEAKVAILFASLAAGVMGSIALFALGSKRGATTETRAGRPEGRPAERL